MLRCRLLIIFSVTRLTRKLVACMPDVTWRILLAQEFMRRQDAILRSQITISVPVPVPVPAIVRPVDVEVDAVFTFYTTDHMKSAKAKGTTA